jgi:2-polyprenyl-3-methyl-5-hydroxy-6-metoxy-1,4-benzoquinol methylase
MDIKNVHFLKRITNKMDLTYYRNSDVITGLEDLENIYTIKNFPVYMGATDQTKEEDQFVDMRFQISKSSGMVQINPLVDLNVVYQKSHNSGAIGQVWKDHHKAFSNFILNYDKRKVLEIGGYSGILANNCLSNDSSYDWTIIDPHVSPFEENIKTINAFFDETFIHDSKFDIVVHSHLIEHVININSFLQVCFNNLKDDGYMIFSLPNFDLFIKDRHTNSLNFEHTFYLDQDSLFRLLEINGFEIVNKEFFYKDHHIFYCVQKTKNHLKIEYQSHYDLNRKIFSDYFKDIDKFILDANAKFKTEENVFVFGGHVTSQFLLCLGLDENLITCLLDNDPKKQNRRLYGTNLLVQSPEILANYESPLLVLKNSLFDEEIREQIYNINKNVRIITF